MMYHRSHMKYNSEHKAENHGGSTVVSQSSLQSTSCSLFSKLWCKIISIEHRRQLITQQLLLTNCCQTTTVTKSHKYVAAQ